ncbi:alpha/beta fold hydrolase [Prodigiosinella aquatilis]|nr:alpha/beta fold hydrolase [Prodigiosinella sp. LS101]WJV55270.1 alpha/beta fold hydrolase [Prodigiosinella sp. LS101]WJV59631.1 alpha/beta fold hydrolase [Pectobacteriaceae bacterium C111]
MNDPRAHLVIFHHAGGSAAALRTFAKSFPSDFNIILMEMPGRGRRRQEPLLFEADKVIQDFFPRIPAEDPIVFIGHSLGAYIAYLMASHCRTRDPYRNIGLVAISNLPIHCRQHFPSLDLSDISQQQLLQFAELAGQLPDWLKQDERLIKQFLQVFAADLSVANSINTEQEAPLVNTPILVIYGKDDPLLPSPPYRWQECTQNAFQMIGIPGDHFILNQHETDISGMITRFIDKHYCME